MFNPFIMFSQSWEVGMGINSGNNKFEPSFTFSVERITYLNVKNFYSIGLEVGIPQSLYIGDLRLSSYFPTNELTSGDGTLVEGYDPLGTDIELLNLLTGNTSYNPYTFGLKYRQYFKNQLSFSVILGVNNTSKFEEFINYQQQWFDSFSRYSSYRSPTSLKYDDKFLGLTSKSGDRTFDKILPYYKIGLDYNFSFPMSLKIGYGSNGVFAGISYVTKNTDLFNDLTKKDKDFGSQKIKIAGAKLSNVNVFDIREMIKIFISDCRVNGIDVMTNDNIKATFEELPKGIVALATGFNNDNVISIRIDPVKWKNASSAKKWYVLYHELGHDVLNLDHGEGGKMMFNYVDRDYSWDEWLNDKKYMFNSYKRNN